MDQNDFPDNYLLPNGNTVNTAYLAALVRFADELDVAADRNLFFDYSEMENTLNEYRSAVEKRTSFENRLRQVCLEKLSPC